MRRSYWNTLRHLCWGRKARWHPLLAVYYLTYACRFRCPKCCDGRGVPYHSMTGPGLPAERALALLAAIRRCCDHVVLTGGEPLEHPELAEVLAGLPRLGFDGVVLTTNGFGVERFLPEIARSVTQLVFSVDTLDTAKADRALCAKPGTFAGILEGIETARSALPGRCEIIISTVAMPDNLDGIYDVYEYARSRGFSLAVCPQLVGVRVSPPLRDNDAYRRLFDFLIAEQAKGQRIFGAPRYLECLRDLSDFTCRPLTMLAVAPDGDVFYPCLERAQIAGNILETPSLEALRAAGEERFGPLPVCDNRCHSACATSFATGLDHPLSAFAHLVRQGRQRPRIRSEP